MRKSFDLDDILNEVSEWEEDASEDASESIPAGENRVQHQTNAPVQQRNEPAERSYAEDPPAEPEIDEEVEFPSEESRVEEEHAEPQAELPAGKTEAVDDLEPMKKPKGKKKRREKADIPEDERERAALRRKKIHRIRDAFLSVIFGALSLLCLAWGLAYLHPTGNAVRREALAVASAESIPADSVQQAEPVQPDGQTENPAEATSLSEGQEPADGSEPAQPDMELQEPEPTPEPVPEEPAKPHYVIDEYVMTAPAPIETGYGTVSIDNASEVMSVIERARESGLLGEEEKVAFDPNANFYRGLNWRDIEYYLDDTIMVILWKENIDGKCCTFTEVKVADASQFRRKLADDTFGSQAQYFASTLAMSTNAVVAMNADYYLFRDFGISVYDRALYRFNTDTYTGMYKKYNCVETLFIDGKGDFRYKRLAEENSLESMQQFIQENDIRFSIAFGPVLVENGQPLVCDWYPVGEINRLYSRAGIGQMGELHYLYMSLNHGSEEARWTVNQFAEHFAEKPVITAYCLDGGQTGEVVFRNEPYNYIDFGAERTVSDIIYFATAIPEEER